MLPSFLMAQLAEIGQLGGRPAKGGGAKPAEGVRAKTSIPHRQTKTPHGIHAYLIYAPGLFAVTLLLSRPVEQGTPEL